MSILLLIVWNIYEKRPLLYSFRDLNSIIITIEDNMPHAAHAVMLSEGDVCPYRRVGTTRRRYKTGSKLRFPYIGNTAGSQVVLKIAGKNGRAKLLRRKTVCQKDCHIFFFFLSPCYLHEAMTKSFNEIMSSM